MVTDDVFDEFDRFRKNPVGRGHDIIVPDLQLFHLYCEERKTNTIVDKWNGMPVLLFDETAAQDIIDWLKSKMP